MGDMAGSAELIGRSLALFEENALAHFHLAEALRQTARRSDAINHYRRSFPLMPGWSNARWLWIKPRRPHKGPTRDWDTAPAIPVCWQAVATPCGNWIATARPRSATSACSRPSPDTSARSWGASARGQLRVVRLQQRDQIYPDIFPFECVCCNRWRVACSGSIARVRSRVEICAGKPKRGCAPECLVFVGCTQDRADHLAPPVADFFLDTVPYRAPTGNDMLWRGVPVLTVCGRAFASRAAAGMLKILGLGRLIAPDLATNGALALALARDPSRLAALRVKLQASLPLFDVPGFCHNLETTHQSMAERPLRGQSRRVFRLIWAPTKAGPATSMHPFTRGRGDLRFLVSMHNSGNSLSVMRTLCGWSFPCVSHRF